IRLTEGVPYDEQGNLRGDISDDLRAALAAILDALQHIDRHRNGWRDIYSPRLRLLLEIFDRLFAHGDVRCRPNMRVGRRSEGSDDIKGVLIGYLINQFIVQVRDGLQSKAFRIKETNWLGEYRRRMKGA